MTRTSVPLSRESIRLELLINFPPPDGAPAAVSTRQSPLASRLNRAVRDGYDRVTSAMCSAARKVGDFLGPDRSMSHEPNSPICGLIAGADAATRVWEHSLAIHDETMAMIAARTRP